jgi:predicted secreted hydrolase
VTRSWTRRHWLAAGLGLRALPGAAESDPAAALPAVTRLPGIVTTSPPGDDRIARGRRLRFPRDFGAHPGARTEWWYATGWLLPAATPLPQDATPPPDAALGFQITFFRSRTGVAPDHPSRFAARQLLFAHAAVTDLRDPTRPRLRHDQRIARAGFGVAHASVDDTRLRLRDWSLARSDGPSAAHHSRYRFAAPSDAGAFALALTLDSTQPVLLQGEAGFSRKGPREEQASHYYSQPQLRATGAVRLDGQRLTVHGTAWLDHEWSETLLAEDAVGWDWIGMNLFDGRALTAFRLRRADGSTLWSGGSLRAPGGTPAAPTGLPPAVPGHSFADGEVVLTPGRSWSSPLSGARYPVEWTVDTPVGRFAVRARLDAQELDSRGSTGALYWEGLSDLLDADGRPVGRGYLEMTGYARPLQL